MKLKLAFTIFSVLMALTGIVMLVFAERITQRIWPDADAYALNIGSYCAILWAQPSF